MLTGIDVLQRNGFDLVKGRRVGLLSNAGTVDANLQYTADIFRKAHAEGILELYALFGPQHGLWGHTQDNMIEWEGSGRVYSLYGANREPTPEMLDGLDCFVVDIPDVGARYYTFIWTMALVMKACEKANIPVAVLDRPNPIGGVQVEGPVLDPDYGSFVGLYPLPTRHGMTIGELACYFRSQFFPTTELTVVKCEGWNRYEQGGFGVSPIPGSLRGELVGRRSHPGWAMPSPNMPTVDTALVYPGMCLLEGTNLSEGRGTTRPFEIFGAPWIDGWKLADELNQQNLSGVHFRPIEFQPTFQKHAGQICGGCFIHVTDRTTFEPVLTAVAVLRTTFRHPTPRLPDSLTLQWNDPPYEYELEKLPIDILAGNGWLRPAIEQNLPLQEMRERLKKECDSFDNIRQEHLLY